MIAAKSLNPLKMIGFHFDDRITFCSHSFLKTPPSDGLFQIGTWSGFNQGQTSTGRVSHLMRRHMSRKLSAGLHLKDQ